MFTKNDIEQYFNAEKQESLVFIIIGVAGFVAAILCFFVWKQSFYKGMSIPFFIVGVLLGIVGYTVYKRSDEDRKRNVYAFDMNPSELKETELPRMKKVMKAFVVYRYTEIILFITGLFLYLYFIRDFTNDFWRGLGLGLAVMSLVALVADFFAENRGREYTNGLEIYITQKK